MKIETLNQNQFNNLVLELHDMKQMFAPAQYKKSDLMQKIFAFYYFIDFGETFDRIDSIVKSEIYKRYLNNIIKNGKTIKRID